MLSSYYPIASNAAKESEERMNEVREITSLVEAGYKPYMNLWRQIVDVSSEVVPSS